MYRTLILVLSLAALGSFRGAEAQGKGSFDGFKLVDKTGNITKPADYRDQYEMLGSWTVLDPKGNQMHSVYASPGTAEYYRRNKTFADGTVLVKEIHGTAAGQMTTGNVDWATDPPQVWFVMIKDAKGRFPNNPLWGNGWGWALFKANAPDKQVATDFKKDCLGCHVPAKADDWIYVKGYPPLHSK
jgi:Cytochrome P460